jgi:nucleotide-binding universal stress UspA family protein
MKRILVPCDFSEQAVEAYRFALDFAALSGGEVVLLSVVEVPVVHDSVLLPTLNFEEVFLKELKERADEKILEVKAKYPSGEIKVETKVELGHTFHSIRTAIEREKADLVVMGTKGASGFKEYTIGSNAEKVVRHAPCPMISVKKYVSVSSIKSIVFPTTLEKDNEKLIVAVKSLQSLLGATLHVVFINTPGHFVSDAQTYERLSEFAADYSLSNHTLNIFGDVYEEIGVINFTHHIGGHMVAMGTHGRKGLAHLVTGSVAEDVVNHIDCPVWTYTLK